jgi:hypothetical protein
MSRRRRARREPRPLRVSVADRLGDLKLLAPPSASYRSPRMPQPPRSARDILALLMASTGLALAAREDAKITLLPGTPTTVVVSASGQPSAAFLLPIAEDEARRMFGQPEEEPSDRLLERLFEEQRQDELLTPDVQLDRHRAYAWGLKDRHAC